MASTTAPAPLLRERNVILATLLALAGVAWVLLAWQWATADGDMSLTMGMGAPLFIAIWVAMMVAMMFPTAAPMILTFASVHKNNEAQRRPFVRTWVFTASYMVIWTLFGVLAYGVAVSLQEIANHESWLMDNAGRIGGGVLVLAGIYQISPLKYACLSRCRTPLTWVLTSWREGYVGSFRMGLEHGLYCLGCCWMLFVILFPLGVMNIGVMALLTLLIFAEKSTPFGRQIAGLAAIGLLVYGALVIIEPGLLPNMMGSSSGDRMTSMKS